MFLNRLIFALNKLKPVFLVLYIAKFKIVTGTIISKWIKQKHTCVVYLRCTLLCTMKIKLLA